MHGGEKKLPGFGDNWLFAVKPREYCSDHGHGCQHTEALILAIILDTMPQSFLSILTRNAVVFGVEKNPKPSPMIMRMAKMTSMEDVELIKVAQTIAAVNRATAGDGDRGRTIAIGQATGNWCADCLDKRLGDVMSIKPAILGGAPRMTWR
jgi:hypothetical protein